MIDLSEISRALGTIEGRLKGIENNTSAHTQELKSIETRLRTVEVRSARMGALTGGVFGLITSIVASLLRTRMDM